MAMRAAAIKAAAVSTAAPRGLRALYSSLPGFSFNLPPTQVEKPPPAEPSTNLFVSGLSKRTTTEGLRNAFAKFGEVVNAKVVTDRVSGYSKGFGFVNYATLEGAEAGIKGMDGQVFLMDPWWNPAVERQAQDRIHRVGQYKEVTVGGSSEALAKLMEADMKFLFVT